MPASGDHVQISHHGSNYRALVVGVAGDYLLVAPLVKSGLGDLSPGSTVGLVPAAVATRITL